MLLLLFGAASSFAKQADYVIVASQSVMKDEWKAVVEALLSSHKGAVVCCYADSLREVLPSLKEYRPRYVAVVEKPEKIGKSFVIELNRMSREVDSDIYEDFISGIITGYDAQAAIRIVQDASKPKIISTCVSTVSDFGEGRFFDSYANLMDNAPGTYRIRRAGDKQRFFTATDSTVNRMYRDWERDREKREGDKFKPNLRLSSLLPNTLPIFDQIYTEFDPDLLVTASHATERNLEMPFSSGNIMCRDGKLYLDYPAAPQWLRESGKARVYLPVGNCLIGNVNNTKNSMAIAWMNSANVSCFVGYVVTTWYGRNGWGGLRTWLTQPGRYTAAEAFFLNRQDLLYRLRENAPEVLSTPFPYDKNDNFDNMWRDAAKIAGKTLSDDQMGQWYDRDVVAYYGDPLWNVRLKENPKENDVSVSFVKKGRTVEITIKTSSDFSASRMEGSNLGKSNLQPQPFTYFFPERIDSPEIVSPKKIKAAVDENFLLLYNTDFKPGETYKIKMRCKG